MAHSPEGENTDASIERNGVELDYIEEASPAIHIDGRQRECDCRVAYWSHGEMPEKVNKKKSQKNDAVYVDRTHDLQIVWNLKWTSV